MMGRGFALADNSFDQSLALEGVGQGIESTGYKTLPGPEGSRSGQS